MNRLTVLVLALATFSGSALAEDFPPFFPESQVQPNAQTNNQTGTNNPATAANQNNTAPATTNIDANQLVGSWSYSDASASLLMVIHANYQFTFTMTANNTPQTTQGFYRVNGNQFLICPDQYCQQVKGGWEIVNVNANSLTIKLGDDQATFVRQNNAAPNNLPPQQQTPPNFPPQQPAQPTYLNGIFNCTTELLPEVLITFAFDNTTYKTYISSRMNYGRNTKIMTEVGNYQIMGNSFYYRVNYSVDQGNIGTTGTNYVEMTSNGFNMTAQDGKIIYCRR